MALALRKVYQKTSESVCHIVQLLASRGVQWDKSCDDVIQRGEAVEEAAAIRVCAACWTDEHQHGVPLSEVPFENIQLGEESTRTYLKRLRDSRPSTLVRRCKICVVAPSQWGKTSLVKSLTTGGSSLQHTDERTIGIDLVKWEFEIPSESDEEGAAKKHEVTFWDFAGQDAYQPAHSLFFTERTLFVLCINLEAYMTAILQTALNAREEHHIGMLMTEFVDENVLQWIRLVFARQPDAEFVLVATKGDRLGRSLVRLDEMQDDFRLRMQEYVELLRKENAEETTTCKNAGQTGDEKRGDRAVPDRAEMGRHSFRQMSIGKGENEEAPKEPHDRQQLDLILPGVTQIESQDWHVVDCKCDGSIEAIASTLQDVVARSKRGYVMPELFTKVLGEVVASRAANRLFTAFSELWMHLKRAVPNLQSEDECREILRTLHALGDVLWWRDLGIKHLQENLMVDPMVPINYIREVVTHKLNAECMPHNKLVGLQFWSSLKDDADVLAMKQLLHEFLLVYPAPHGEMTIGDGETKLSRGDVKLLSGEMKLDSDLIVPAYWKSNTWAVWKFGGDQLHLPGCDSTSSKPAVRVLWQYRFRCHLPLTLFDQLVIASCNAMAPREIGPDWILYECGSNFACRLVVCRHMETLERAFEIEAVASKSADPNEWGVFEHLCLSLTRVLTWYRGLLVDCSVLDASGKYHQLERVIKNWQSADRLRHQSRAWLPPDLSWCYCSTNSQHPHHRHGSIF